MALEAKGLRAFCTTAQIPAVAAHLLTLGVDGDQGAIFGAAADSIVRFSEETHTLLASFLQGLVPDLCVGVSAVRGKVLRGIPWGERRTSGPSLLKSLDRMYAAHCELKHFSPGRL